MKKLFFNLYFLLSINLFADFSEVGPYEVEITTSVITLPNGDETQYRIFLPNNLIDAPHVILAHGFVGSQDFLFELSKHFSSWGLKVATIDLINSNLLNNNPLKDAEDLVYLSNEVFGGGEVIYAGYSSGGLRALISTSLDSNSIAYLGLDIVNSEGLAEYYIQNNLIPFYGLVGEPSVCNSQGNSVDVFSLASNSQLLRITEADHCDFQNPASSLCALLCQIDNMDFSSDQINIVLKNLSTSFLVWQANLDADGLNFWTSGYASYDNMINNGSISDLVNLSVLSDELAPDNFDLYKNYPNPFNPTTQIRFDIKNRSMIDVKIYDLEGSVVKNLFSGIKNIGNHTIKWDAKNNMNSPLPSGIYFCLIKSGNLKKVNKMTLIR